MRTVNQKNKKLLSIFLAVLFIFIACKKEEGYIDSMDTNYNSAAAEDGNLCAFRISGPGLLNQ